MIVSDLGARHKRPVYRQSTSAPARVPCASDSIRLRGTDLRDLQRRQVGFIPFPRRFFPSTARVLHNPHDSPAWGAGRRKHRGEQHPPSSLGWTGTQPPRSGSLAVRPPQTALAIEIVCLSVLILGTKGNENMGSGVKWDREGARVSVVFRGSRSANPPRPGHEHVPHNETACPISGHGGTPTSGGGMASSPARPICCQPVPGDRQRRSQARLPPVKVEQGRATRFSTSRRPRLKGRKTHVHP